MASKRDLFIAIDANAIVHRAFHAYPPNLSTSSGVQVNAVYGFTVMLLAMLKQFDPKYVFCAFDTKAPTFRHAKYSDYKGKRKPTDESLIAQFPIVEQVLEAFNIPIIKKDGFEADDILGTIAHWTKEGKWSTHNFDLYLLTGDRDLLQLIGKNVFVCLPSGSFSNLVVYDAHKTLEKYGYLPEQVTSYKSLVGDPSDNIPGVKGVGEKTALSLISQYGNLENILKNIGKVPTKPAKLITEGVEQAQFSMELATISTDIDLHLQLEQCLLVDFNEEEVATVFKNLEFKSLMSKIPKSAESLREGGRVGQFGMFGEVKEDDFNWDNAENDSKLQVFGYIQPNESIDNQGWMFEVIVDKSGKPHAKMASGFTKYQNCETWTYNYEEISTLIKTPLDCEFIDICLLSHNLSSGRKSYSLSSLAFEYSSRTIPEKLSQMDLYHIGEVVVEIVNALKEKMRNIKHSEYVSKKIDILRSRFDTDGMNEYEMVVKSIEIPISNILSRMERRGVEVDIKYLNKLNDEIKELIKAKEEAIYHEVGHEFNINSPKQLASVLYDELSVPQLRRDRSTREEVLSENKEAHPCIPHLLEYRELSKIYGTYINPLIEQIKGESLVVHTDFKQIGTSSGRFSSINPNMQNLPARGDWAQKVRRMFVPRKGYSFVGADYSQIEFRIMADISEDKNLISDFNSDKDIHRTTASRILDVEEGKVTPAQRSLGKTINFGILFGQGPYSLSRLAGIDTKKASEYIDEYFRTYLGVAKYIQMAKAEALDFGYVQSMFGRTRHIAGLTSRNKMIAAAALREAVNMPIQGGEADIMKLAMIDIDRLIAKKYENKAFMLLQIHDELVFEVSKEILDGFMDDLKKTMISVIKLNVPLDAHVNMGKNMGELK